MSLEPRINANGREYSLAHRPPRTLKARSTGCLEYNPDYAVPPGETLVETMECLGQTSESMAQATGLSVREIEAIRNTRKAIDEATAERLERGTGVPARFWMNLERNYQERLAILTANPLESDTDHA